MKKNYMAFFILCFSLVMHAQELKITQEVKDHIKERVDKNINVSIVVGLIDGEQVDYFSYGNTALNNGTKVNEHSVYEIGSISKTFTGALLANAVVKGEMQLSDPISKYLPSSVKVPSKNGKEITLKDLATHSSGLPRLPNNMDSVNPNNPYADYTVEQLYEFISKYSLTRDVGESYAYSNLAMGLLGHILELKYDKSFEDLLIEHIANVYDMNHTRIVFTDEMNSNLAKGHAGLIEAQNWDLPTLAGAGAIRSTASDMVKYIQAQMGTPKTSMHEAMQLSQKEAYVDAVQNKHMALGWHLEPSVGFIMHNGATGGYTAFSAFNPDTQKGAVVLTNSTQNVDGIAIKLLVPEYTLVMPKMHISNILENEIETNGMNSAIALYKKLKAEAKDDYNFDEGELNNLGYVFLGKEKLEEALAVFKLNVEMHPEASNPYDSLGEAYLKKGDSTLAITNYEKSLALDPKNDNARTVLNSLGVKTKELPKVKIKDVEVAEDILETYVGKYQLAPAFIVTVTKKDKHLFVQATGQPQFEVFASAQNKFYLKVVEASVTFNADDSGKIVSMTLHQGGQNVPGNKIE